MTPTLECLTDREEQVILMLAEDMGQREIAARLGICPRTVRWHRSEAVRKLGCSTTYRAVRLVTLATAARR